jgi:hypothetical protein
VLDQGQVGYCWAHSTTQAVMVSRALSNQPYVPLSAYAVAATIKRGADEGGWCGLSAQFARDKGIPAQSVWPQGDRNYRSHDKPEVWASAAQHKITEEWTDLAKSVYDQNLTFDQLGSGLMSNLVGPRIDNWWSSLDLQHGRCRGGEPARASYRLASGKLPQFAEFNTHWGMNHPVTGGYGIRILNSWSKTWSDGGFGVLSGSKAVPDGALADPHHDGLGRLSESNVARNARRRRPCHRTGRTRPSRGSRSSRTNPSRGSRPRSR